MQATKESAMSRSSADGNDVGNGSEVSASEVTTINDNALSPTEAVIAATENDCDDTDKKQQEQIQDQEKGGYPEQSTTTTPPPAALPTEWTQMGQCRDNTPPAQRITYPHSVLNYPSTPNRHTNTELVIVGTSGQKITQLGSQFYQTCNPYLTQLVLRSHLITKMEGLYGFRYLNLLELYDNQIKVLEGLNGSTSSSIDVVEEEDNALLLNANNNTVEESVNEEDQGTIKKVGYPGCTLHVLDMSYNVIRDMGHVQFCPNLVELYLANNKLKTMAGLSQLSQLRKIDLGANRIRYMDPIELNGLVNLEELWLGKNKIESIHGLEKLTKLQRLDLQANRLTCIENLTSQVDTLEEIYLSHNGIDNNGASHSSGLALPFSQLSTLDVSRNRITSTHPFQHLIALQDLWLSGNDITTFDDVQPLSVLGNCDDAVLEGIYLEFNPVALEFEYRKRVKEIIPSLTQIDSNAIHAVSEAGASSTGGLGGTGRLLSFEERMKNIRDEAISKARAEQEAQQRLDKNEK